MKKLVLLAILAVLCSAPLFALKFEGGVNFGYASNPGVYSREHENDEDLFHLRGMELNAGVRFRLTDSLAVYGSYSHTFVDKLVIDFGGMDKRTRTLKTGEELDADHAAIGVDYTFYIEEVERLSFYVGGGMAASITSDCIPEVKDTQCVALGVDGIFGFRYEIGGGFSLSGEIEGSVMFANLTDGLSYSRICGGIAARAGVKYTI